ncbi:MAG: hypothetical protein ACLQO1_09530 [Steroidobacteraceae bacterium]
MQKAVDRPTNVIRYRTLGIRSEKLPLTPYRSRFWEGFSGDDDSFKVANDINGGAAMAAQRMSII